MAEAKAIPRARRRLRTALHYGAWLLGIAALAWASQHYRLQWDWSQTARNTLSPGSVKLLAALSGPVQIRAFLAADAPGRRAVQGLVQRYQQHQPNLRLQFLDPADYPDLVRELNIHPGGELLLEYAGRREKLRVLNEQSLSNALLRLSAGGQRWVAFLGGHGERDPHGQANADYQLFAAELQRRGLRLQILDLEGTAAIPDNAAVLVIADPRGRWPATTGRAIEDYLARGGSLLWLAEPSAALPNDPVGEELTRLLQVRLLPGTVISARTQKLGIENPAMVVIDQYPPDHPITRELGHAGLLIGAAAIAVEPGAPWEAAAFLRSSPHSWTERGPLDQPPLRFDADQQEQRGPLTLGISLRRRQDNGEQRVAVVGDSDFLSNRFLANGANQTLGINLLHWLSKEDRFIAIDPRPQRDLTLALSDRQVWFLAFGFPLLVPVLLLGLGALIFFRRRRGH